MKCPKPQKNRKKMKCKEITETSVGYGKTYHKKRKEKEIECK